MIDTNPWNTEWNNDAAEHEQAVARGLWDLWRHAVRRGCVRRGGPLPRLRRRGGERLAAECGDAGG